MFKAFDHGQIDLVDAVITEKKVALEWRAEATHSGQVLGIKPTGKHLKMLASPSCTSYVQRSSVHAAMPYRDFVFSFNAYRTRGIFFHSD